MANPRLNGADELRPVPVGGAETYPRQPTGPKRRAALRDRAGGTVLGYVWTDDRQAAGWDDVEEPGPASVRAEAYVWRVHRHAYQQGRPVSELLRPELYAPLYYLDPVAGQ